MAEKIVFTQKGYDELVAELNRRKTVDREKIKNDIAVARSFGDLSENSEYDEARNAQATNETRILELEKIIENAEIQSEDELETGVINLGSFVTVFHSKLGKDVDYELVSSNQSDPSSVPCKISDQSPIGKQLMGKKEGDKVEITVPTGVITLTVKKVTREG